MRSFRILIFLSVLSPFILMAQTGYKSGYVILPKGDTIRGFIDNISYYQNSIQCHFKRDLLDTERVFLPGELLGYRFINGKYYVTKQIGESLLFLEYLINGKLNVFFYQDATGENHYLLSKDTMQIRELEYVNKVISVDGDLYQYESKRTKGLLSYYTSDCPQLKYEIEGFKRPDHKNLIQLAEQYHKMVCTDNQCIIYEKNMPLKVFFQASFGANYVIKNYADLPGKVFYPSLGGNLVFNQPQRNENLYLGIGYFHEARTPDLNFFTVPLSMIYQKSEHTFSPYYAASVDLVSFGLFQEFQAGLKFRKDRFSAVALVGVKTVFVVTVVTVSPRFYISYDLSEEMKMK